MAVVDSLNHLGVCFIIKKAGNHVFNRKTLASRSKAV
jgi:hypothetical protein